MDESSDSTLKHTVEMDTVSTKSESSSVRSKSTSKVRFAPDPTTLLMDRVYLPRLVEKSGTCNVESRTVEGRKQKFMSDIFTTLLDTPWRMFLPMFVVAIFGSWLIFAILYYISSKVHGDFNQIKDEEDWGLCVENAPNFINLLLFSMETQTTIGYGYRYVNVDCAATVIMMLIQSILGALLQALLTGLVIAKIQKPKKRSNTILFSRNVCIFFENGHRYLAIRVGDLQRSDTIETRARAIYVRDKITKDGEFISHFRYDLDLDSGGSSRISLRWPVVVRHLITPCSPFWNLDQDDIRKSNSELIVFMQGIIETTGMTVQTRTSYLPSDIVWDRKFKPMMTTWKKSSDTFDFDYSQFDETIPAVGPSPKIGRRTTFLVRRWSPSDSCYGTESGLGEGCDTDSTEESEYSEYGFQNSRKISNLSQDITSLSEDNSG